MPMTDDRTPHLNLPLPYADNMLEDDSDRLRTALTTIDTAVAAKQSNLGYTAENLAAKGVANGYAGLGGDGRIPAGQLPSYVDDVIEVANFAALPVTGEFGKIYVSLATNLTYRWGGSAYVEIASSPGSTDVVPEGATNLYHTPARAEAAVPIASPTVLGKVKVGAGLGIDGAGLLFASAGGGSVMSVVDVVPASNGLSVIPIPAGYVVGAILVAFNGSLLGAGDYTATTGTSITLVGFTAGTVDTFTIINLATVAIGSLPAGSVGSTQLASSEKFAAGTRMPFAQAAAPTGWTQDTTDAATNRMLRVVNTTGGGTGGNTGHSPILMNIVPNHTHGVGTLATGNDTPDHAHTDSGHAHNYDFNATGQGGGGGGVPTLPNTGSAVGTRTGYAAIGGATARHSHPISGSTASNGGSDWQPRYIDLIICAKA